MASSNDNTFGTKVLNAQTIVNHLKSFTDYSPARPTDSVAEMETLIESTKTSNQNEASKLSIYSVAVDARQKAFFKDEDCLQKILSPIGSAVKSQYDVNSKQDNDCMALITKCRSQKAVKSSADPEAKTVSQAELSYGSLTQTFSDLIEVLASFTPAYNPANESVKLPQLRTKLETFNNLHQTVTTAFGQLQLERKSRNDNYEDLSQRCQRIKNAVKSQYGNNSTQYNLIKGLKV